MRPCSLANCGRPVRATGLCYRHYKATWDQARTATTPARVRPDTSAAPWIELLAKVLADTPALPGAACRQYVELYDRAADGDRDAAQEAIEVCGRCPVLKQCAAWIARSQPRRPPPGVWAAHYQPPPPPGKRKKKGNNNEQRRQH